MNRIISYRGLLEDGAQDTIPVHTNDGKTGYKIVKFQLMAKNLGSQEYQNVVKIFSVPQTGAPTSTIDFSDQTLLAAGYYEGNQSTTSANENLQVIFDNIIFNQDIHLTHKDDDGLQAVNYYIELEQVSLTEDQALVAIVKNLRNEQ